MNEPKEGCMTLLFSNGFMNANMLDTISLYILAGNIWNLNSCNMCLHGN